jgi:hypothetical protein
MHERLIRFVTVGMIAGALAGCNLLGSPSRSAIRFEGAIAALGTTVELGTIETADGDATVFLPSTDSASLYETLNASQVDLLVTAQRDNYLKAVQNEYLNQSANVIVHYSHFLRGRLDAAYNETTTPADANIPGSYYFFLQPEIADEAPFTGSDVDSGDYYLETFGPPAAGPWSVLIDGQTDGVYELGLASPYDNADNFMYNLPVSQSYELLTDVTDTLPLAGEFSISIRSFDDENPFEADTSIDLPAIANTELEPPVELYWEGSSSTYNLSWIDVSYSLGATYVFEIRKERWFF